MSASDPEADISWNMLPPLNGVFDLQDRQIFHLALKLVDRHGIRLGNRGVGFRGENNGFCPDSHDCHHRRSNGESISPSHVSLLIFRAPIARVRRKLPAPAST